MTKFTDWLNYNNKNRNFSFNVIDVEEKNKFDDEVINYLKEKIIFTYRSFEFYKHHFGDDLKEAEIKNFLLEQILPKGETNVDKRVRQGDWGEVFAETYATEFSNFYIPITKLRWKFNKDKSVFATDLIAFNDSNNIKDIYYYEIKTRINPNIKEGSKPKRYYIPTLAHESLSKEEKSPTESILNFLEMYYIEKEDYISAAKFKELVRNPKTFNRKFEIFLILEKNKYEEKILLELENHPPTLNPLNVTVVLIENLEELISKTWENIENSLVTKLIHLAPT